MSNPLIPPVPLPDDDRTDAAEGADPTLDPATVEHDGDRAVDPDADPDLIDSAEADRLASGAETEGDAR